MRIFASGSSARACPKRKSPRACPRGRYSADNGAPATQAFAALGRAKPARGDRPGDRQRAQGVPARRAAFQPRRELRWKMRSEIVGLHRRLGATMIYVTHDQVEAMTMADTIVMLREGIVEQTGRRSRFMRGRANRFVASFLGAPQMNMLAATAKSVSPAGLTLAVDQDRSLIEASTCGGDGGPGSASPSASGRTPRACGARPARHLWNPARFSGPRRSSTPSWNRARNSLPRCAASTPRRGRARRLRGRAAFRACFRCARRCACAAARVDRRLCSSIARARRCAGERNPLRPPIGVPGLKARPAAFAGSLHRHDHSAGAGAAIAWETVRPAAGDSPVDRQSGEYKSRRYCRALRERRSRRSNRRS